MSFLRKLFGGKENDKSYKFVERQGKVTQTDRSFDAWTSGDLNEMLKATKTDTNPIDRHFLLQTIVAETYKRRKEKKYRDLCIEYSEKHIEEFKNRIEKPLKADSYGQLPRISTFQHYATLLTELGDYDKAIEVCKTAVSYDLDDGTKSGYEGRIERIEKKRNSNS
ncbi:MAG: hypothetical protein ACLFMU_06975 [Bacteroidales bacterium]